MLQTTHYITKISVVDERFPLLLSERVQCYVEYKLKRIVKEMETKKILVDAHWVFEDFFFPYCCDAEDDHFKLPIKQYVLDIIIKQIEFCLDRQISEVTSIYSFSVMFHNNVSKNEHILISMLIDIVLKH